MMTELLSLYKDQIEKNFDEKKDFEGMKIKMEDSSSAMKIEEMKQRLIKLIEFLIKFF